MIRVAVSTNRSSTISVRRRVSHLSSDLGPARMRTISLTIFLFCRFGYRGDLLRAPRKFPLLLVKTKTTCMQCWQKKKRSKARWKEVAMGLVSGVFHTIYRSSSESSPHTYRAPLRPAPKSSCCLTPPGWAPPPPLWPSSPCCPPTSSGRLTYSPAFSSILARLSATFGSPLACLIMVVNTSMSSFDRKPSRSGPSPQDSTLFVSIRWATIASIKWSSFAPW